MDGKISAFRGSHKTQKSNQMIIVIPDVSSREKAEEFIGRVVSWKSPGKKNVVIKGKVSRAHGNAGAVRVVFERGMPGQSLGSSVSIS